jgi:hypothetical protein
MENSLSSDDSMKHNGHNRFGFVALDQEIDGYPSLTIAIGCTGIAPTYTLVL